MFSAKSVDERETRIRWFGAWNSELNSALVVLSEPECCPHELYKLLCEKKDSLEKRFAIITDERSREPIAVVCLRKRKILNDLVPLIHYTIPGMIFPVRDG